MSLKAFHIIFVAVSVLLSLGLAAWGFHRFLTLGKSIHLLFGIGGLLAAAGLLVYGRYFLKKLKNISYL
ncbi:MAG: hypothetical protein EXS29_05435 [Pedosphaera sp.]|nr:hypothetical protein [Pedosphaera sp.]MST00735.1 hypothetical protein [Pedosphaera sp.]